jgi:CDP-paratose 2-epimerase
MAKVLVTGGAGFIGSNVSARYMKKGHEVVALDNFSRKGSKINSAWLKKTYPKIRIVDCDIRDKKKLDRILKQEFDFVFHLAGQVAVTTSVKNPREDFDINAMGTVNLLESVRKTKNDPVLVYSSTNKVYGGMENVEIAEGKNSYMYKEFPNGISEDMQMDFHSPYGCSKGAADQYVRDYSRIYGLKTMVFRQSCIYGYRQFGIEDQGWLAWFIIQGAMSSQITIYGDGKQVRDVLFIDDLCDAYEMACKKISKTNGQVYNIGGGPKMSISLLKALEIIKSKLGKGIKISFDDPRPGDQKIYISGISKARKDFGWFPKTGVDEGIGKLCSWVTKNKRLFR